ncbi:universal stress protein [Aliiroseovarius sp. 2305UL8-7]|uniref:universal stress protein n=1 Tax=Aliiroseovarius conchicola TaxID=3121637 RepID=UPI00352724D8
MRKTTKSPGEKIVKDIKRATRKHYSSEEKIRIVLDGLRGEDSIAELCRREGISQGIYYKWSNDFMEAGKKRLAGDTARAANTDEVKELRREAKDLKEVVAEQTLEGIDSYVMSGHSTNSVLCWANKNSVDCIVVASHRAGLSGLLLGSAAARVVRHAQCSVVVLR